MPEKQNTATFEHTYRPEWTELAMDERRLQIRELIISPWWDCLNLEQRQRWLDQLQDLTQ